MQVKRGDPDFRQWQGWGKDIITTAVFAILITAPIGLLFINHFGDKLLTHDPVEIKLCKSEPELQAASPRGARLPIAPPNCTCTSCTSAHAAMLACGCHAADVRLTSLLPALATVPKC